MSENILSIPEFYNRTLIFRDREHAGKILADLMKKDLDAEAVLLAIPAGGVPVAMEISAISGIPMDLAVVSKITLPWNTEAGYGAVAFDGTVRLNEPMLARMNLTERQIREGIEKTTEKVRRRNRALRGDRPFPALSGQTAVLVDDGLASGFTMRCAIEAVQNAGARSIAVAVPTAHEKALQAAAEPTDRIYCPNIRSRLPFAVADAYENWYDISEPELFEMLQRI